MPFDLTNKNIIVTGASSGIGRQCAVTCASMGASVTLFGRDEARLVETLEMMEAKERHSLIVCDFLGENNYDGILKSLVAEKGKLAGIVHSAGISTTQPFRTLSEEKLSTFNQVNVHAPLLLTKSLVKPNIVADAGASVVFLSSVMGLAGEVGKTIYSMTKGALLSASRSLALELAPRKIRVNCISPGVVETPMSRKAIYSQNEDALERIKSHHPLGLGTAEDVANACLFLLSDEARWITGTNLIVDGGYTAK